MASEHCPEHSGVVTAVETLKEAAKKLDDVVEKVTDIRIKTAKTSATIGAAITGGTLLLGKIVELVAQHYESIKPVLHVLK